MGLLRFFGRFFGLLTLISLFFWAAVAWHVLSAQPVSDPPAGYPANVAECRVRWAQTLQYPEQRKAALGYCERYYALLGDRTAPIVARLREQVLTRFASLLIMEYMDKNPPQPGETVTGPQIIATMGTTRIAQLLAHVVTNASDPHMIVDKAEARCRLDEVHRASSLQALAEIEQKCLRPR